MLLIDFIIWQKYKLVITGGSDYHGGNTRSDIRIGSVGLDYDLTKNYSNIILKMEEYTMKFSNLSLQLEPSLTLEITAKAKLQKRWVKM